MSDYGQAVYDFYQKHLVNGVLDKTIYTADCPFCNEKGFDGTRRLTVTINRDGFFHGFFRCLNQCVPGGFPLWYSSLAKIDPSQTPGFDPDREYLSLENDFPVHSINQQIRKFQDDLSERVISHFQESGISESVLRQMAIGYNGRYVVYPYFQDDGNCYSARCVYPDRPEDNFWHGEESVTAEQYRLFNVQDIQRCENGTLILCEGEDNLLTLKQMGLPGIAVPDSQVFESIDPERFAYVKTLFISTLNNAESEIRARAFASRIGHKVRLLNWPTGLSRNYSLWQLARDTGNEFSARVISMARNSRAFSPFATPKREHDRFFDTLSDQLGSSYEGLKSGFPKLDEAIEGIHGINVVGGAPKVGKSCFLIQIATEMARRKIPVVYYDFENGRQKIYQRTMARLSRIPVNDLRKASFAKERQIRYDAACREFQKLLVWFRVVNDRKVTPEIMRRHVDFIRHETQREHTVVVIDSLHKLPFKDFSERRTGIDAWLRQFESIRDEMNVSFLIISELSRGDKGSYRDTPHMGVFKGSGDIEYSADNALVIFPDWSHQDSVDPTQRNNNLWLVASREHSPGLVASYQLDYPYWGFSELSGK
jgi:replicative DNA helicase